MINGSWYINPFHPCGEEPILRDVFPNWLTGNAIFHYLSTVADMPWKDSESVDDAVLDVAYFGNHSGGKFCSPLVKLSIDSETGYVTDSACTVIAKILVSKYLTNWTHLWETNVAVYNPINNYDMVENRVLRRADSSSENENRIGTDTTENDITTTETDSKYGLNTLDDNPKPSDKIETTDGGTVTTDSELGIDRNRVAAGEEEEQLTRSGNIGVTTTQQMLTSERELWLWNFFDQVFNDLDRELALMFHDSCRV